ncbi:hypothetical protein ACFV99_35510 [Streptomyces sp. NPDC059944]|uniref:hypothetical protein n=1 Tax=unclassified Streptomyces TaxID=2593676 RepID=UPI003649443D
MPDMSASLALTHLVPLAKEVDENKVTPGVLGFIVFAVMALAVWGLMKSMNRHMGKVTFPEDADTEAGPGTADRTACAPAATGTGTAGSGSGGAAPAKG